MGDDLVVGYEMGGVLPVSDERDEEFIGTSFIGRIWTSCTAFIPQELDGPRYLDFLDVVVKTMNVAMQGIMILGITLGSAVLISLMGSLTAGTIAITALPVGTCVFIVASLALSYFFLNHLQNSF